MLFVQVHRTSIFGTSGPLFQGSRFRPQNEIAKMANLTLDYGFFPVRTGTDSNTVLPKFDPNIYSIVFTRSTPFFHSLSSFSNCATVIGDVRPQQETLMLRSLNIFFFPTTFEVYTTRHYSTQLISQAVRVQRIRIHRYEQLRFRKIFIQNRGSRNIFFKRTIIVKHSCRSGYYVSMESVVSIYISKI